MEMIDTVVIGGGQAGLVTSYWLKRAGIEHVVLEKAATPAPVWRTQRWDSFTMVTPNWSFRLPGSEYNGDEPDGFMPRTDIVSAFDQYVTKFDLPIQYNTRVESIERSGSGGYEVRTANKKIVAVNVVVATGFFQSPRIPKIAAGLSPDLTQLHSSSYRNSGMLPDGAVLIVGSAQSGCQIAEELNLQGRTVYQSTGGTGRAPRRYRGMDIIDWLDRIGFFDLTPESLPSGMSKFEGIPHVSGTNGGHTLNLHQFARDGIRLFGRLREVEATRVRFDLNLHENLSRADQFEQDVLQAIDEFIDANGMDLPPDELAKLHDGFNQPSLEYLDLEDANVRSVIWATGFDFDYSLVKLPVHDADGFPIQVSGVTSFPGLYFVGMPWMPSEKSGFLIGVGDAAKEVVEHISSRVPVKSMI